MSRTSKKFEYDGQQYDSQEEVWFAYWLEELKTEGYINKWIRNYESIEVAPSVISHYNEGKKKKKQTILQNLEYTPDFVVYWNTKAVGKFCNTFDKGKIVQPFIYQQSELGIYSIVEIKPEFDKNNMTRLFRQIQKILYSFHNQYVNLVIPQKLFKETFTPLLFRFTKTGKPRKITKWKVKNLKEHEQSI